MLTSTSGYRARALRLLDGKFQREDVTRLLLFARDRAGGRKSVRDIGDFIAHHGERTKGIVHETVQDWNDIIQFQIPNFGKVLNLTQMPSSIIPFLRASINRTTCKLIRKQTKIKLKKAITLVDSAISKFKANSDGTLSITEQHTEDEISVILFLREKVIVKGAFDLDCLYRDFSEIMINNNILKKDELRKETILRTALGLTAIAEMHSAKISLKDGSHINLFASIIGDYIHINASIPTFKSDGMRLYLVSTIFAGNLSLYCSDALRNEPTPWNFEIEMTENLKLDKILY